MNLKKLNYMKLGDRISMNQEYLNFMFYFVFKKVIYLTIDAEDDEDQDLTQYFSKCFDFIHKARNNGGNVLVHW
jgi:hypothetical protein